MPKGCQNADPAKMPKAFYAERGPPARLRPIKKLASGNKGGRASGLEHLYDLEAVYTSQACFSIVLKRAPVYISRPAPRPGVG